jgi:hypothetical protein
VEGGGLGGGGLHGGEYSVVRRGGTGFTTETQRAQRYFVHGIPL